ncbi:hypothetical protein PIB30_014866 [Stylosanthes scabra]|uniref:Uncharacterized protein n=1 Tax=Stylosanthes scabra TaxID=79078 RepID=A0ABU6S693_9FABA|nr:hypothetical protein [Stylosanthes scabra]
MEKDLSEEQVTMNNNREELQETRNILSHAILNEWDKGGFQRKGNEVLEETQLGQQDGRKQGVGINKVKQSEGVTKNVEKLGNEEVKDRSKALDKVNDKDYATEVIQTKELEKTKSREKCVSNFDSEVGGYEDEEDLMAILKEQNEALALKRRKAKQKEKAQEQIEKKKKQNRVKDGVQEGLWKSLFGDLCILVSL